MIVLDTNVVPDAKLTTAPISRYCDALIA